MQHFFLNPKCFTSKQVFINDSTIIHQMQKVLRMEIGDEFIVLDNTGDEFICSITELTIKNAVAKILEKRINTNEATLRLALYQAMPKRQELFEWVLQKGTEIGVSKFVPIITSRSERRILKNTERLNRILREASEQSERGKIPELLPVAEFGDAVRNNPEMPKILLHGRGEYPLLSAHALEFKQKTSCAIFIGPEGGFSEEEIKFAEEFGVSIYSLGPRVLRTETAGIAAAFLILL